MHVYFFGVYNAQGGMENYALNLISGMKKKYTDVDFTLLVFKNEFSGKDIYLKNNYSDYIILPDFFKHPIMFLRSFNELGKKVGSSDLIQLNVCTFRNFLLFWAVSKLNCRRIIVSHYSKNDDGLAILHYINRKLFHKKYQNLAVSDIAGEFMFKNDYTVIPNGVVSEKYAFNSDARRRIREHHGIDENTFLIGQVGRITKEKNQDFSIDVLKKICKKYNNVKLMLVGKYYNDEIKKLIDQSGLSEKVLLTGPIYDEIGQYYSAFDCFILPSKNEAMPIALLEALSNGLPTVYSKNVPSLDIKPSQLGELPFLKLDLNTELWVRNLSNIIESPEYSRENYIQDSEYELTHFVDTYHDIYIG